MALYHLSTLQLAITQAREHAQQPAAKIALDDAMHSVLLANAIETTSPPLRNKYLWPGAAGSIWNMPIGYSASYVPAGILPALAWHGAITKDDIFLGLNSSHPLRRLNGRYNVHVPPTMQHDGSWNGIGALLDEDGVTVRQGQPLVLSAGGDPSWPYSYPSVDIAGDIITGAHGGSGVGGLGGPLRAGWDLSQTIPHALAINLYAKRFISFSQGGYRWPAARPDSYASPITYAGSVPQLRMGALLALRPSADLSSVTHQLALRIAVALRNYGGYVVDDTAWDVHALSVEAGAYWPGDSDASFHSQMQLVFRMLCVVDNNSPTSIGGGGAPLVPLAPAIA